MRSQARYRSFETLRFKGAGIRICEGLKYCNSLLQAGMFDKEAWIRLTLLAGLGTYLDLTCFGLHFLDSKLTITTGHVEHEYCDSAPRPRPCTLKPGHKLLQSQSLNPEPATKGRMIRGHPWSR